MIHRILALLFRVALTVMRRLGVVFVGDTKRATCLNCGTEAIEHVARENKYSPGCLAWGATSEHVARCGLVCSNGMTTEHWEREKSKPETERQIHNGVCPRCGNWLKIPGVS